MKSTKPGGGTKRKEDRNPIETSLTISCSGNEFFSQFKAPGVDVTIPICFPLSELEFDLLKVALSDVPFSGTPSQRVPQGTSAIVEKLGCLFFTAIFKNGVRQAYKQGLERAVREQRQLRLRLIILAREFSLLPLEFLFDPEQQTYLCLHPNLLLVRSPVQTHRLSPLRIKPPLNILIWISDLQDQPPLDAIREENAIKQALAPLQEQGLVSVTCVRSWDALQTAIESKAPWHVFHLIGHGTFDASTEEYLIGVEDNGHPGRINAQQLANLLKRQQQSLRLVFLSLCEGDRAATLLAEQGIQAIVAQQADISNEGQIKLVRVFYSKLTSVPVDAVLANARLAMMLARHHALEWITLVLYLSSTDALLFEVEGQQLHPTKSVQHWLAEGESHYEKEEYAQALTAYGHAVEVDPTCVEAQECLKALQEEMPLLERLVALNTVRAEHADLPTDLERLALLIELRRYRAALTACEELISTLGISASWRTWEFIYRCKGDAHGGLGESNEATAAYIAADSYKR